MAKKTAVPAGMVEEALTANQLQDAIEAHNDVLDRMEAKKDEYKEAGSEYRRDIRELTNEEKILRREVKTGTKLVDRQLVIEKAAETAERREMATKKAKVTKAAKKIKIKVEGANGKMVDADLLDPVDPLSAP